MTWDIAQRATGFGPVGYSRQADIAMDRIRLRARELWEAQGRPEGKELEIWTLAETQVAEEMSLR